MNTLLHQLFSPQCKMIALDLDPRAEPTARTVIRFLFQINWETIRRISPALGRQTHHCSSY